MSTPYRVTENWEGCLHGSTPENIPAGIEKKMLTASSPSESATSPVKTASDPERPAVTLVRVKEELSSREKIIALQQAELEKNEIYTKSISLMRRIDLEFQNRKQVKIQAQQAIKDQDLDILSERLKRLALLEDHLITSKRLLQIRRREEFETYPNESSKKRNLLDSVLRRNTRLLNATSALQIRGHVILTSTEANQLVLLLKEKGPISTYQDHYDNYIDEAQSQLEDNRAEQDRLKADLFYKVIRVFPEQVLLFKRENYLSEVETRKEVDLSKIIPLTLDNLDLYTLGSLARLKEELSKIRSQQQQIAVGKANKEFKKQELEQRAIEQSSFNAISIPPGNNSPDATSSSKEASAKELVKSHERKTLASANNVTVEEQRVNIGLISSLGLNAIAMSSPLNPLNALALDLSVQPKTAQISRQRVLKSRPESNLVEGLAFLQKRLGLEHKIQLRDTPLIGKTLDTFIDSIGALSEVQDLSPNRPGLKRELMEMEFDLDPIDTDGNVRDRDKVTTVRMQFYVNPDKITVTKTKNVAEVFTRGGWSYTHWGERPPLMNLSGTTARAGMLGIRALDFFYQISGKSYHEMNSLYPSVDQKDQEFYDNLAIVQSLQTSQAVTDALKSEFKDWKGAIPTFAARKNSFSETITELKNQSQKPSGNGLSTFASGLEKLITTGSKNVGRFLDNVNLAAQAATTVALGVERGITSSFSSIANVSDYEDTQDRCLIAGAIKTHQQHLGEYASDPYDATTQLMENTQSAISTVKRLGTNIANRNREGEKERKQNQLRLFEQQQETALAEFRDEAQLISRNEHKYGLQSTVRIRIYHEDVIYIGHIKSFNYNRTSEKFIMTYGLDFTIEEEIRMPLNQVPKATLIENNTEEEKKKGGLGVGIVKQMTNQEIEAAQLYMHKLIDTYGLDYIDRYRDSKGNIKLTEIYAESIDNYLSIDRADSLNATMQERGNSRQETGPNSANGSWAR